MRKYTAYRPGEERFDGQLYRTMVRAERRARENPRVNTPPSPPPVSEVQEPETPPSVHPLRQMLNAYKEEKEREKLEKARQRLTLKAKMATQFLQKG
ncbi:hypothetical protein AA471_11170 [Salmonella enterica subsp. enterica]|nr:hypothetical protein [Salmonella enterica subsp. enterica]EDQ2988624.1 hypothetical protein [Salmonella enterica subsp. enterica]